MNIRQLIKIKSFSKKYYSRSTGKYHDWNHIQSVRRNALEISKHYHDFDAKILEAAVYLHDIGRSKRDEGHNKESARIARPFLKKIGLNNKEIEAICHAIISHDKDEILNAKTTEAKVLFDADKMEILSVNGFIRICLFLVEERKMEIAEAINFLWDYSKSVQKKYLQTKEAKIILKKEMKLLSDTVKLFNKWPSF